MGCATSRQANMYVMRRRVNNVHYNEEIAPRREYANRMIFAEPSFIFKNDTQDVEDTNSKIQGYRLHSLTELPVIGEDEVL